MTEAVANILLTTSCSNLSSVENICKPEYLPDIQWEIFSEAPAEYCEVYSIQQGCH